MGKLTRWGLVAPLVSLMVAASAQQTITYTVKKGDSLYTIAHRHGLRLPDLLRVNNLRNPHALQVGDKIKIPVQRNSAASRVQTGSARSGAPASGWAELNKDRINVRSAPDVSAKRITIVDRWTKVQVLARQGEWSRVRLANGREGWVKSQYLSPAKPPKQAKQVVSRAKRTVREPSRAQMLAAAQAAGLPEAVRSAMAYLGTRYRYGGSGSRGFDCSGFTMHIYRKHGIHLPHNSSAQYRVGVPVARHELKPGDLVFFRTRGRGISHVGIYIGDGKFIHASSSRGRVRIDTLNSGYYQKRYVGARRVVRR